MVLGVLTLGEVGPISLVPGHVTSLLDGEVAEQPRLPAYG